MWFIFNDESFVKCEFADNQLYCLCVAVSGVAWSTPITVVYAVVFECMPTVLARALVKQCFLQLKVVGEIINSISMTFLKHETYIRLMVACSISFVRCSNTP